MLPLIYPAFYGWKLSFLEDPYENLSWIVDRGVWDVIENYPYVPMHVVDGKEVEKYFNTWSQEENRHA